MKKYKLIKGNRYNFYGSNFKEGEIYLKNKILTYEEKVYREVLYYVEKYPEDWEEVIKFNAKEYLINILNDEELYVELENVDEVKKLFEIIERLKFSLNKKSNRKEKIINITINYGRQVRFNLSKDRIVSTGDSNAFIKFSEIIEHIKQQVNK